MRSSITWWQRSLLAVSVAMLVSACSIFSDGSKVNPPTPLEDFEQHVSLDVLWDTRVGRGNGDDYIQIVPAITGQAIFAAEARGRVVAMDRRNGERIWKTDIGSEITGGVGAGFGLVLLGTEDGEVVALSATDGSETWRRQLTSEVLAPPQINQSIVLVQSMDDNLHALNPESGEIVWVYDNSVPVLTLRGTSRPLLLEDLVIAGFANGKLLALDAENGQQLWEYRVGIPTGDSELERMVDVDGDLAYADRTVFAASYQGRVAAVDANSGVTRWDREVSSYLGMSIGGDYLYVADDAGYLMALDRQTSNRVWKQEGLAYRQPTMPVALGPLVIVGDAEGFLHLLLSNTGTVVGRTRIDSSGIRSRPIVRGDTVYVMSNKGRLAAYQLN